MFSVDMSLQRKIYLALVPTITFFIVGLGVIASFNAIEGLHESSTKYIEGVLQTYLSQDIAKRHELLVKNRLDQTPSFMVGYQKEAAQSAANIKLLWPGHIFVFNVSGHLVFDTAGSDPDTMKERWGQLIQQASDIKTGGLQGHIGGEFYRGRMFEPWNWIVFIAIGDEEVHRAAARIRRATILITLVAALSTILIISLLFRKFIVRPVEILRNAASQIASQHYLDLVPVRSADELGSLAREIEKMSADIKRGHDELLQLNQDLERLVAERTESLRRTNAELQEEVAERRQAEAALKKSEDRFRAIFESTSDSILVWDRNYKFMFVNEAVLSQFMTKPERVIGRRIHDVLPHMPEFRDLWIERIGRVFTEQKGFRVEDTLPIGDRVIYSESVISPIKTEEGETFAVGVVYRDITARKEMEKALEQYAAQLEKAIMELEAKNRDLDEFTYVASHDLQEPLRKLIAFSSLLQKDLGDDMPERAASDLGYIVDAADRMQNLIQDLLALSRAGRKGMKWQTQDLNDCANDAVLILSDRIEEANATITRDDLPEVRADRTMLTQLYQNLIGNALKFTERKNPKIRLTHEKVDGVSVLGIKDDGIGMKPEYAEKIFTPFRRLHSRTEYEGSGVGLAICRKIVDRHNGRIWVETDPGRGAHFKFTIGEPNREFDEDEP